MANKQTSTTTKKIANWLVKKFIALMMLFLGVFLSISFISYNETDPYYNSENSEVISNIAGYWGGYVSGTLLNYFDFISFIFPFFFLIWGTKLLLGIKINLKFLRIVSLLFLLIIIPAIFLNLSLFENIIGNLIYNILLQNYYETINNPIIISIKIAFAIIAIPILFFSLSISNKYVIKIFIKLVQVSKFPIILFSKIFTGIIKLKKQKSKIEVERQDPLINEDLGEPNKLNIKRDLPIRKKTPSIDLKQKTFDFEETVNYELPRLNLLKSSSLKNNKNIEENKKNLETKARKLEEVLSEFGIQGKISDVRPGPIVTMYELEPSAGTKASRIINLADDIARSMSALSARISSQPGRNIIGIELPNIKRSPVFLDELLTHEDFQNSNANLVLALGKNIAGIPIMADLEKMPHLLIAGTTGSGKSVGLNSMIISLLYKLKPSECRLILIDPKMLELSVYEDIPHLMAPVVTDPHKAITVLKWAVKEMEDRYRFMNHAGVKNIISYNIKISEYISSGKKMYREVTTGIDPDTRLPIIEKQEIPNETFPYIVIVIDEMADLMMVAGKDVEHAIQRLAQMARAAGIHLIMATQRPSVDVITGTIKANFPSRISYHVASKFDSRTILNETGAEQLLGSGDMLFMESGGKVTRLHGGFISEKEINNVVKFVKNQLKPDFSKDITSEINLQSMENKFGQNNEVVDDLYDKAVNIVVTEKRASTSFIQRHLQIGYNRAARIIEQMEREGIVSEGNHVGKREVLKKSV